MEEGIAPEELAPGSLSGQGRKTGENKEAGEKPDFRHE
jgi:hypothetical protein